MLLLNLAGDGVLVTEDEVDLGRGSTSVGTEHDGAAPASSALARCARRIGLTRGSCRRTPRLGFPAAPTRQHGPQQVMATTTHDVRVSQQLDVSSSTVKSLQESDSLASSKAIGPGERTFWSLTSYWTTSVLPAGSRGVEKGTEMAW